MTTPSPELARPTQSYSWRGVSVGLLLASTFAVLAPMNDWLLHNTFLYGQFLPTGLMFVLVLMGVVVNPVLGRYRFGSGDLRIMMAMVLVAGGVVSSGLNAYFPAILAGPAHVLPTEPGLERLSEDGSAQKLFHHLYIEMPEQGAIDRNSPDYRTTIDGFHQGLPAGSSVSSIPWPTWLAAILPWLPLLGSAVVAYLAIAAIFRRQWMEHERLTYPIAQAMGQFIADPLPGQRFAEIYRNRWFWYACAVTTLLLVGDGLRQMGLITISFPLEINLWSSFRGTILNEGYAPGWLILKPTIYFSIVAITFLLPSEISLSLWVCFVGGNLLFAVLNRSGMAIGSDLPARVSMGGWFAECLLILWLARRHLGQVFRAAITVTSDPEFRALRPIVWAFVLGAGGLVISMVALGSWWSHALIAAVCYLAIGLVLARLVAEAGIPFLQAPMMSSSVVLSFTGVTAPVAVLIPLTMLGQTLSADPREHLLPFATNAEYLVADTRPVRWRWGILALITVALAAMISGVVMVWCAYMHDGQRSMDSWWCSGPLLSGLGPIARDDAPMASNTYAAYAVGGTLTGLCGYARVLWSWWPIHPVGILVAACFPIYRLWFSLLLGWLAKVVAMRYGGVHLYRKLVLVAMGLIAGEALVAGVFLIIGLIAGMFGNPLAIQPRFLPG